MSQEIGSNVTAGDLAANRADRISADASFERGVIPPAPRRCLNCQTPMTGPYCYQCGQHEKSSLRHFGLLVRDIIDDVLNLDSRVIRTLKPLLFKPGFLTSEYMSGRRMRYVPPLRLYVIASVLFFLAAGATIKLDPAVFDNKPDTVKEAETMLADLQTMDDLKDDAELHELENMQHRKSQWSGDESDAFVEQVGKLTERAHKLHAETKRISPIPPPLPAGDIAEHERKPGDSAFLDFNDISAENNPWLFHIQNEVNNRWEMARENPEYLKQTVLGILPQSMFILLPLFALLLKCFFPFSRRLYAEHLIVAVHSHCFLFLSLAIIIALQYASNHMGLWSFVQSIVNTGMVSALFYTPIYLFVMQKKVYGQGFILTLFKYCWIGIIYTVMLALTVVIDVIVGLLKT